MIGGRIRLRVRRALLAIVLASSLVAMSVGAEEGVEDAQGSVFVIKAGKIPLRASPKLGAPSKGQVAYGQKLSIRSRTTAEPRWLRVQVPGDPATGWIPANATLEKRPSIDAVPIAAATARITTTEGSTASAIRGLDGRAAAYAKEKQLPPEAFDQLSRLEGFGEQLFSDRHHTDATGGWHYADATAPGRISAAEAFGAAEGLRVPRPPAK